MHIPENIEAQGHLPVFMAESPGEGTFESRLANVLDSIDEGSKKLEHWVNKKRKKGVIEEGLDKNVEIGDEPDKETESVSDTGTEDVDEHGKVETLTETAPESSYQSSKPKGTVDFMEQAPLTKPRRPRRRSEYGLYEWVLLLGNLVLWPVSLVISVVVGSGVETSYGTFNMEENYLMLLGPLAITIFFFTLLYKMDANARDGSLYAAEKQSYLDEMEKYLEARTAYLELVALQAQMKKKEILSGSSEE